MNLGWSEIVLIMLFALLLFGPKRLPEIGRQIGRAVAEVRKVSREFEREVRSVTGDWERELSEVTGEIEREVRTEYALDDDHSTYLVPKPPVHKQQRPEAPPPAGPPNPEPPQDAPPPGGSEPPGA